MRVNPSHVRTKELVLRTQPCPWDTPVSAHLDTVDQIAVQVDRAISVIGISIADQDII